MTAPMTAAEYRMIHGGEIRTVGGRRLLAALEEREALLEQAKFGSADASVGALVRRIREHPMNQGHAVALVTSQRPKVDWCDTDYWLNESGLTSALSHLDSLLPKEPEVVTGESGRQYRRTGGKAIEARHICADGSPTYWATVGGVPVIDAPVVAKLMAKGGKDGE